VDSAKYYNSFSSRTQWREKESHFKEQGISFRAENWIPMTYNKVSHAVGKKGKPA